MKHVIILIVAVLGFGVFLIPENNNAQDNEDSAYEDIAAIFYYGNGDTRIHTWVNNEDNSFKYSGSNGWFSTKKGGYEGNKLVQTVSGDWNGDGFSDIAGFYDYGNGITRIHVWLNTGRNRLDYQSSVGWWESTKGYDAKAIVQLVAGDFNGDKSDDIAAFYDYGNDETRIHVWLSDGQKAFKYESSRGWWAAKGYPAKNIISSVAGEFGN